MGLDVARRRAYKRRWRAANRDRQLAIQAAWYLEHKDRLAAQRKREREDPAYKQQEKERKRRWYDANKAHVVTKLRRAAEADPARERARQAAKRKRHPDTAIRRAKRRQARKRKAYVEDVDRLVLFVRDVGVCQICREPISDKELVMMWLNHKAVPHSLRPSEDHIVPLARRGEHSYANTQLAHLACNCRKSGRKEKHAWTRC